MGALKIGVMGAGRGLGLAGNFLLQGCTLTAVCDNRPDRLQNARNRYGEGIVYCDSFEQFIEQDMDAVILANFFHEHATYAVECLKHGIHVSINENRISIDFHVIVAYGVNIGTIAQNLIDSVTYKLEETTGMKVDKIRVLVEGVRIID